MGLLLHLVVTTLLSLGSPASAAFTGMGGSMQEPACAYSCRSGISSAPLACTPEMDHHDGHGGGHMMDPTTPQCRGSDPSFLTSLAYCINKRCTDAPVWQLEQYWAATASGDPTVPAKWDYHEALDNVEGDPDVTYEPGSTLNSTQLISDAAFDIYNNFLPVLDYNSYIMFLYSIVLLVVGFAAPIAISLLSKLPVVSDVIDRISPYVVYPSTIGRYHVQPLPWILGNPPTTGQALYISGFSILNVILTCVNYKTSQPHPWGYNKWGEILAYVGYRTGEFGFALLPLAILFSGRNNILLWLTDWSYSTYLLLHRWVARWFAVHTIIHSVFLLAARLQTGTYSTDKDTAYWQWGIVGTVFCCAMLVFALLWLRRLSYEVFLIAHIVMGVFTLVGSWLHLYYRFGYEGSHEYWLYAAAAVWVFERLMRVLRIAKNGRCKAVVTDVGPNHVRVDITGVRFGGKPGYHGYVYFPTLHKLTPWENHPFSVNSTAWLRGGAKHHPAAPVSGGSSPRPSASDGGGGADAEKRGSDVKVGTTGGTSSSSPLQATAAAATDSITLYVRKSTGMTKALQQNATGGGHAIPAFVDGPYRNHVPDAILRCDRVLLVGGGIGITGLVAWLHAHTNIKLAWSVNSSAVAVAADLKPLLDTVADREIRTDERLDVRALLEREAAAGYKRVGVVVCGPGGLCDYVRAEVARLGRHSKTVFELEVDAFSW